MNATCAVRVEITALPGIPIVEPGDDLAALIRHALDSAALTLRDGDVLVVASKAVSRAEGRFVDLATVTPSPRALELAARAGSDPRVVELALGEAHSVSRVAPGALIIRHRLGFVSANASIDASNAAPGNAAPGSGPWVLLVPRDPDASAEALRAALHAHSGASIGVVISDSLGRPFRLGTVGAALGVAGVPAINNMRGDSDLFGRQLEHTETALADQLAAAGDLVAGQAGEGRCAVHLRGLSFTPAASSAQTLIRPLEGDLYA